MTASSAASSKLRSSPGLEVAAMVAIGMAGAVMTICMPGILAALAGPRRLSTAQLAWLASSELGGLTAATVLLSPWVARIDRRLTAQLVLVALIAAHGASMVVTGLSGFLAARLLAGICEGALLSLMSACVTGAANPDRIFAIYLTGNLALSATLLKVVGQLSRAGQPDRVFLILMVAVAIALLLTPWLPARAGARDKVGPAPPEAADAGAQSATLAGIAGLAGTLLLLVGVGATWPLAGQMGLAMGLSAETVAGALSNATIAGVMSGLVVYGLGQRLGRRLPIIVSTLALAGAMAGFAFAPSAAVFTVAAALFMFFWVAILPYISGVMAALDPAGRLASLCMAMQLAGLTLGPILAAALLPASAKAPLWLGLACAPLALVLLLYAEHEGRRGIAGA